MVRITASWKLPENAKKCAASLYVFLYKKYVVKAKRKDEDVECRSELEKEENANIVETNIEIKVEEEFPSGINVVKKLKMIMMMCQGRELQCTR